MSDQIICPHCHQAITITEAITKHLQVEQEAKFKQQLAVIQKETEQKMQAIAQQEQALLEKKENLEEEIRKKTEAEKEKLKQELWKKAVEAASQKSSLELKDLHEQLKESQEKQAQFEELELKIRKEKRELEESRRTFELEMTRKIEQERKQIQQEAEKFLEDKHRLELLERDKQIEDMKKLVEAARRKAVQGSQQNQGEVLELDLERQLKEAFLYDHIQAVGKGVSGADLIQTVCTNSSKTCGIILWEIKQTKHWTENWISKFKDDLRAAKANIPVLVSTVLPKDVEGFTLYQGVWVTKPSLALSLAIALRKNLIDVSFEKAVVAGKGEKQELLYQYVSSHEFRQRVETLVEVYQEMKIQIEKERVAFERSWRQREMQLHRFISNAAGMYGEMQGLVGSKMQEIKGLELDNSLDEHSHDSLTDGLAQKKDKTLSLF